MKDKETFANVEKLSEQENPDGKCEMAGFYLSPGPFLGNCLAAEFSSIVYTCT